MKQFQLLLCVSLVLLLAATAQAKARYLSNSQMIETAEAIAVVEITGVTKASVRGKAWIYRQKASAKVERVLKGNLPYNVSLYGDESFMCAHCHFEVGRYLVFLDRDKGLLTGNNWHYSARKISQNKVDWLGNKKTVFLSDVVKEIKNVLTKVRQAAPKRS